MPKLTKRVVESVLPLEKDIVVRDNEIKGFICKITPKGRRVYMLYYRTHEGRERKPAIGEHGKITCEQARDIAKRWMAIIHDGGDPSLDKQNSRKAETLADLAEKYMANHAIHKKPASATEDQRMWNLHILPTLGRHSINSITKQDVLRLHHNMKATPVAANRVIALLSKAFNLAMEWGIGSLTVNPAKGIKKYSEQSRETFLSPRDLTLISEVLKECEVEGVEMASVITAIRLLIITGCRRNEILALKWNWIDLGSGTIDFPDSKTGKKTLYLSPAAIEILSATSRSPQSPYVCVGKDGIQHLVNIQKPWNRIRTRAECYRLIALLAEKEGWKDDEVVAAKSKAREGDFLPQIQYKAQQSGVDTESGNLIDVRIHDLRHSFASTAAASGMSLFMIGKLLGHKNSRTTERYAHLIGDPMREAANIIGGRIAGAMEGNKAEVLPLRKV